MPAPSFDKDAKAVELFLWFDVPSRPELLDLLEQRGTRHEPQSKGRPWYRLGPVILDERLIGSFAVPMENEVTFHLHATAKPSADPPEAVVQGGVRVGGPPGLHAVFADEIGRASAPPICTFVAKFRLDAKQWRGPVPRAPHPEVDAAIAPLGEGVVEQVGYRFTQSVGGLSEVGIVYAHAGRAHYRVEVQARGPIKTIDEGFRCPVVVDACDLVLAHLFSDRGDPDAEAG